MAGKRQKLEVTRYTPHHLKSEDDDVEIAEGLVLSESYYDAAQGACASESWDAAGSGGTLPILPEQEDYDDDDDDEGENGDEQNGENEDEGGPHAALSSILVASPVYPNAVKWSDDNLIAVATSQLITILNPASIEGPRGFVTASSGQSLLVGTVQRGDLDTSCLLPIRLFKDLRPVVRSMDWSPQGLAPNGGCLLAVCTKDYRVKLYRAPHYEFQCEWVELQDLSEILHKHHLESGFDEFPHETLRPTPAYHVQGMSKTQSVANSFADANVEDEVPFSTNLPVGLQGSSIMDAKQYVKHVNKLAYVSVAWSPILKVENTPSHLLKGRTLTMSLIALGAKSGDIFVLRVIQPVAYTLEQVTSAPEVGLAGVIRGHGSWVSALSWSKRFKTVYNEDGAGTAFTEEVFLATGSTDGSVKLWGGDARTLLTATGSSAPLTLIRKVVVEDHASVTSVDLMVPSQLSKCFLIAVGKASGTLAALEVYREEEYQREAYQTEAHSLAVMGVTWAFEGRCLYSCSQDNGLHAWKFTGNELLALPFPEGFIGKKKTGNEKDILPNSVLDGYYGLGLSKGSLALATVRGVATELLDQMYQSRAMKAVMQVIWVGGQQFNHSCELDQMMPTYDTKLRTIDDRWARWESSILAALHHFESTNHKLVLWDIITCLTSLSSSLGRPFLNSVVSKWLLSLGFLHTESQEDGFLMYKESMKESLSNTSCRCLQIAFVLFKRLYLSGAHKPSTIVNPQSFYGPSNSIFECPEKSWHRFLLDVEHELRERMVHLLIISAEGGTGVVSKDDELVGIYGATCMLQWAVSNSPRVSPHLLKAAQRVAQSLIRHAEVETCSTCNAKVPFMSPEVGECEGDPSHKVPRCSITLQICPPKPLWFCSCCAHWTSKQTPRIFLKFSSRHAINNLEGSPTVFKDSEPTCPFCGVLIQRYLPDCFLRLSLI